MTASSSPRQLVNAYLPDPPSDDDDRFARAFKPWREWNVAVKFLTNLHCGADDSKVFCIEPDPPDVVYEDARFEVKEILDPRRRRHDEVKAARRLDQDGHGKSNFHQYTPKDLSPIDMGHLVLAELENMRIKGRYTAPHREHLDLLFYINKLEHWFEDGSVPVATIFESFGWRSISAMVDGGTSIVFYAKPSAPTFLIENVGRVRQRYEPLDN